MKNTIYKKSIYIAKPIGKHNRLINKKDPTCLQVNDEYIKYGKSLDTESRKKDYEVDNDGHIIFYSVVDCKELSDSELTELETRIGQRVKGYRQTNPNRKILSPLEWCKDLQEDELVKVILEEFQKLINLIK